MGQKLARIAAELMGVRVACITTFVFSEPKVRAQGLSLFVLKAVNVVLIAMCNCIFRLSRMVTVHAI